MDVTEEELQAAAWQIRRLRFAQDKFPDMVDACGCVGPCAIHHRLVDSFLAKVMDETDSCRGS